MEGKCNKRKDTSDDFDEDSNALKKARYSWQIEGFSNSQTADKGSVIKDLDDLSLTLGNPHSHANTDDTCQKLSDKDTHVIRQSSIDLEIVNLDSSEQRLVETENLLQPKSCQKENIDKSGKCEKCVENPKPTSSTSQFSADKGKQVCSTSVCSACNSVEKQLNSKKDLSVHLLELENATSELRSENTVNIPNDSSHLSFPTLSSDSPGQMTDNVLNLSDSEAEEEALLFSSPQRCTNSLDFDLHLARWQNQHAAKAIVDNAINKTLEEMGVSPVEDVDEFTADKYYVEDEGIAEAIRRQGLIRQPEIATSYLSPLYPVTSTLTTQQPESDEIHQEPGTVPQNLEHSEHSFREVFHVSDRHSERESISASSSYQIDSHIPVSNSELIDQAVTMAICSQGLALQNNII